MTVGGSSLITDFPNKTTFSENQPSLELAKTHDTHLTSVIHVYSKYSSPSHEITISSLFTQFVEALDFER
jgi:hypothetical protein